MNPDKIRPDKQNYKNFDCFESKPTRFQTYTEREVACRYTEHLFKTQYCEKGFDMKTGKMNKSISNEHPSHITTAKMKNFMSR